MIGAYAAFALPLGADSSAVCAAYGASTSASPSTRLTWQRRLVIASTLASFEALMPGVGMVISAPVGHMIGSTAHYFAGLLLVALAVFMLLGDDDAPSLSSRALLLVGLAVSVDEIAVGVSFGLHGVAFVPLALTIGAWVLAGCLAALTLGARLARHSEKAEAVAALLLCALGVMIGLGVL